MIINNSDLGFNDLEYLVPFIFTIFLISAKLSFGIFLIRRNKKKGINNPFMEGTSFLMIALAISRTSYLIFDFYLTKFDTNLFYVSPNVWFWKFGNFVSSISIAYLLYIMDKKVMNYKFRGIFTYAIIIISLIQFLWPVNDQKSFNQASTIGAFAMVFGIMLPLTFLYLGFKTSGELKKASYSIFLAILVYALTSQLVNEAFLDSIGAINGSTLRIVVFALVPIVKILALGIITFYVRRFNRMTE